MSEAMQRPVRVLVVAPATEPEVRVVDGDSLEAMQAIVGGYIEPVYALRDVVLFCNEDGISMGLPANRPLPEIGQTLRGTFFLTGPADDEGDASDLTDEQIEKYRARFALAH